MKSSTWSKEFLCCMTLLLVGGWQTVSNAQGLIVGPLVPMDNEQIIRDQLIIIVDVTGSIGRRSQFRFEKELVQAFTDAMPNGTYVSGIDSFAGVNSRAWVDLRLMPFNRVRMVDGAASIEPLGSLTPLDRSIYNQRLEITGRHGRGALLIFSDGKVRNPQGVLDACRNIGAAHGGELCIFTVDVGNSARGAQLLQEMATVNGCGRYYDGAALTSEAAMHALARDIFLGPREMPPPLAPAPPLPEPVVWKLQVINFPNDVSVVAPSYDVPLDEAAMILKNNPNISLHLHGHTDSNASNAYNQKLSERRVDTVKAAFVKRGVAASRIETQAHGEENPTVPNDSPSNMHTNRRVELYITE